MQIQVKVTDIFPAEEFNKKDGTGTFKLRKIWAQEVVDQYPQDLEITFMGPHLTLPDLMAIGGSYTLSAAITGRKWTKDGRQGINMGLRCWAVVPLEGQSTPGAANPNQWPTAGQEPVDDLPF